MSGTIIVTGAAGALGRGVAERLAAEGWDIVAVDHIHALPACAKQHLGGVDLTDEAATERAFATLDAPDGIQGLVNIAGGFAWEKIVEGSKATWDRLYALNLATALNASKAAIPLLRRGGAIVNIGAAAAAKAEMGMGAYAASKSAVARLTEALAAELKGEGIRVNAILPSIIDTPANRKDMPEADFAKWVTVPELAEAIAFLLSDRASGITGAAIPVTGRV
ncbi:MAG TPA: SDR family oxidoreductase [Allosphingosinicella sp.]|jgi:NAD(P)-dependent dehydrogenase (short-subunit alcohol dehydrogenase family)|nr:SDR family oxidoreductase [Allosphingosinicella sp.]